MIEGNDQENKHEYGMQNMNHYAWPVIWYMNSGLGMNLDSLGE